MATAALFDLDLIKKYDVSGPRYTSYPTAMQFHEDFNEASYIDLATKNRRENGQAPLSLYFHIPFCDTICYYCACNKIVTKNRQRADPYLQRLYREIEMQAALHGSQREVTQLHWGGGTPTFLSHELLTDLFSHIRKNFNLSDVGEYSIEIDPRTATTETIQLLGDLGFNRLSCGVQDFEPAVQIAVNRVQSEAQTLVVLNAARINNFKSISLDLIYGLPEQTVASFNRTLDKVIDIRPDRLSVFNYAHMPQLFKTQKQIDASALPDANTKLRILESCIDKLVDTGYEYIGMDHFALPNDELTRAQREGSLHRNFQGYSTQAECDLVAMGVSSIGKLTGSFSQNVKDLETYYARLDADCLPVYRGYALNRDDQIRHGLIMELICNFKLDISLFEQVWDCDFNDYFATALKALQPMQEDGLLELSNKHIQVLPPGRLLIRNICMLFDAYLQNRNNPQHFSKAI